VKDWVDGWQYIGNFKEAVKRNEIGR